MLYSLGVMKFDNLKETASGQLVVREAVHQYLYTIANSYGAICRMKYRCGKR